MKSIYPIAALALLAASCKEQPVALNTGGIGGGDSVSSYVASVEAPMPKKILVEEFTGVQCTNCPAGATLLESLNEQNGDNLNIVSIHAGFQSDPIHREGHNSKDSLQTNEGYKILMNIFGEPGNKPSAVFNRLSIGSAPNKYLVDGSNLWPNALSQAQAVDNTVPLNVHVSATYNQAAKTYDIVTKVAYCQQMSGRQILSIYLTQDSIYDVQEMDFEGGSYDDNHLFMHVFRTAVTDIAGMPILDSLSTKEAGRVFYYKTSVPAFSDDNWRQRFYVPKNMHVVALVSSGNPDDIHVYQSAITPLTGDGGGE